MALAAAKLLPVLGQAACLVTLVAMVGINLYAGPRIGTPKVPMQWSLSGEPAWFAGKHVGLWLPVAVALLVTASLVLKARQAEASSGSSDWVVLVAACCLILGVHAWHISAVLAWAAKQT